MVFDTSLAFIGLYLLAVLTVEVPGWVITRVGVRFEGGRFPSDMRHYYSTHQLEGS